MADDRAPGGADGAADGVVQVPVRRWRQDLRLLRQRDLGLLIGSRLISDLGTGIAPIALAFGVLALPGADAASLGFVLLCAAVPRLVFSLVGGVLADRVDRARLMVVAEVIAAAAQLASGLLFLTGHATVGGLAALAVLNGIAVSMFYPAMTGLVPQLASGDDLQSANAFIRLSSSVSMVLGTAIGGLLVATTGAGWALVIDALTYAVSAALLAAVRARNAVRPDQDTSVLDDLVHGWREFSSRRWVWFVVVLFSLSNIGFAAAIDVLGPVQALQHYDGARGWSLLLASFFAGTLVGIAVAIRIRPGRPLLVAMASQVLVALPLFALGPPLPLGVVCVLAFVTGICIDVFEILWQTALQQNIPPESLSRVAAYDWLGSTAFIPLALAGAGFLAATVGLQTAIWISALLGSATLLGLLDPQVRGLRAGGPYAGRSSATTSS